jgi:uncharacterized OB-fold protein
MSIITSFKKNKLMIIHCLSCGKAVSSNSLGCPYCHSEITSLTLEMNGIEEKVRFKEKVRDLVVQFVHR